MTELPAGARPVSNMLQVDDVTIRYGEATAVQNVSLTIDRGEFVSFLGPSGCGKTTLLRSIAGYVKPYSGRIILAGEDVTNVAPRHRRIGMVFQNYALFPHMNVAANVGFSLRVQGWKQAKAADRAREMLDIVQLGHLAERYPAQLSGGQQQRVALARALAFEPKLLLLDEPLGALDLRLREAMQTEILRLQRRTGVTAIFVTHDQGEALSMSDRVAVMNNGRIEQIAAPRDIYAMPDSAFVADFVGRSNVLALQRRNGRWVLSVGESEKELGEAGEQDVSLSIRPEKVEIYSEPRPGSVAATVVDVQFNGLYQAIRAETASGQEIVAHDGGDWSVGQTVHFLWDPRDARLVTVNKL